ncbi:MAG: hypothetical protein BroJett026_06170 [Betaproteobacteria bacterium]|nr:MAG: hypothetical protein BroJett026_06170 [Betaproteobacteria bacterium]
MDTVARFDEQRLFHSTGRGHGAGLDPVDGLGLRPAPLAGYRDLARLRYDFPLVLVAAGPAGGEVRSLSAVIDGVLREVAPRGLEGERLRRHVLRLEREIRALAAGGTRSTLGELWTQASQRLASPQDPSVQQVLSGIGDKLDLDGWVVDCDGGMPADVVTHLWQAAQRRKGASFRRAVDRLVVRLSDILRAAFDRSAAGRQPDTLRATLGGAYRDAFDFGALSKLLVRNVPQDELAPARRQRIEWARDVLQSQPFHVDERLPAPPGAPAQLAFRFTDCASAVEAYRARLPRLAEVVKAIAIAELEADGRYVEAKDDPFFAHFDESALSPEDLALFPDYLVCIPAGENDAPRNAGLMDMLSSGLPVKVLVETTDLVEEAAAGTGHFAFGVRAARLANTATGLGGVYVVQAAASNLYAMRERIGRAFEHRGAGLLSVYVGTGAPAVLPPYLLCAAAMESRAFPAFAYDPHAGTTQAARFVLADNPQPEADWPVAPLDYADEAMQRVRQEVPFTVADFLLCDRRYAPHFARVPRERWNDAMVPADEWLALDAKRAADRVPYVLAVDGDDVLQRVVVDAKLMQAVVCTRTFWHRLQEQGGIHNSHAAILVARERAQWEAAAKAAQAAVQGAPAAQPSGAAVPQEAAAAPAAGDAPAPDAPARDPDVAWIETARCPSCNECQTINDRMFKYDANKQAYIADLKAGTYRQLVEAAESCQVAIIHPGKPWNPDEPGLDELLERAKPFR